MKLNRENGSITLPDGNTIAAHTALADLVTLYPHVHPLCPCA